MLWSLAIFLLLLSGCSSALELTKLVSQPRGLSSNNKQQRSGSDVVGMVRNVWDKVVAQHEYGLSDPRGPSSSSEVGSVLSPEEAYYHYSASQRGIVDSARFLVTFGVATELSDMQSSSFYQAMVRGDLTELERVIARTPQLSEHFPLHVLASVTSSSSTSDKQLERMLDLIIDGIPALNVEATPNHGATALMVAASVNHSRLVSLLVRKLGANVHAQHAFAGTTALHFACEMGHLDALRALTVEGARVVWPVNKLGGTALHTAADANRPQVVAWLLANGTQCDANALLNGDTTALYLASQRGHVEVVNALLDWPHTLVDFTMPSHATAKATKRQSRQVVAVAADGSQQQHDFYDSGSKNQDLANGATALHVAAENGRLSCIRALLRRKAKQLDSMRGSTPLLIALQYKHEPIALELMKSTSDDCQCNVQSPVDGAFPLFVASGQGYERAVRRLLELGCDVHQRNRHGASALSHALYRAHLAIARLLIEAGAEVGEMEIEAANAAALAYPDKMRGVRLQPVDEHGQPEGEAVFRA